LAGAGPWLTADVGAPGVFGCDDDGAAGMVGDAMVAAFAGTAPVTKVVVAVKAASMLAAA
jgi:hypothetical protein